MEQLSRTAVIPGDKVINGLVAWSCCVSFSESLIFSTTPSRFSSDDPHIWSFRNDPEFSKKTHSPT